MRVLVLGGTAFTGPRVVRRLHEAGHEVTVFHRGRTEADLPEAVRHLRCPTALLGDRSCLDGFLDEIRRFAPAVVLDMIAVTEADARATVERLRGIARRLVVISSQDVYRAYGVLLGLESGDPVPVPMSEEADLRARLYPYRTDPPRPAEDPRRWMDDYDKILVERAYMAQSELPATVLRWPMVYGPDDRQHRMAEHLRRMVDQRPAILLDSDTAAWRWTRAYVDNVAEATFLAVVDDRAAGRIYNVGEVDALPMEAWVAGIARAAGWAGKILSVPAEELPESLRSTMRTDQDFVTDSSRIREELGYREPVDRETALARTAAWEREHLPPAPADLERQVREEDAVFARLRR